ncbi:hypothetical protein MMC25_006322 [Agyrium rufum]|nr:hypothetical protein [Agyrium rufum]
MFRILEAQAPVKQTATDTISTLSGRLQSATLLEDRRAAILGLRSFAKIYPASVASGALRNLINSLSTDGEDADTAKVLLETLLMLFNPDESSPEASDDIALWLADEFTQRQENITILLDFLERNDFYSRLYSLQLIIAILSARPERTQECVYTAPLGVSRLVATLDDRREAIRTEGIWLLTALTTSSPDLQKLIAFENAFDRIFNIIEAEGSLSQGGVVVQDCLSLLANLLRLNASNQSFFRETGWMSRVAKLLREVVDSQNSSEEDSEWAAAQREKNLWGLLAVIRLFLFGGSVGTQANQAALWQSSVVTWVLAIAFHPSVEVNIRAEALETCADLIRRNNSIQERFAQQEVALPGEVTQVNGHAPKPTVIRVNIIQALLDLSLSSRSSSPLELRLSASECVKAYLIGHKAIRLHFLGRAREGHLSDQEEDDNILTILLDTSTDSVRTDPIRHWIASIILFHLLYEDYEAKNLAMSIAEGDAEEGEEVVTCIQLLSANMCSSMQRGEDDLVGLGYQMVLCGWLWEDPDAINDFLGEGSTVQNLVQIVLQPTPQKALIAGLCTFLLGIVYEFSTKDSPIPRSKLHEILTSRIGRDQYIDKLTKLREHHMIRDHEILGQTPGGPGAGDVKLDAVFVDFVKDNYSRVLRAIDREPGMEISVIANGIQKGVSREMVDQLQARVEDREQAVQKLESQILNLERQLSQEQADHRKAKETATIEVNRIRTINEHLQRNHEEEARQMLDEHKRQSSTTQQAHEQNLAKLRAEIQSVKQGNEAHLTQVVQTHERAMADLRAEMQKARQDNDTNNDRLRERHQAEIQYLRNTAQTLQSKLDKVSKDHAQDLQTAHEEYSSSTATFEARLKRAEERADEAEARVSQAKKDAEEKDEARAAAQTELDDMLIVLGDLEEKRVKDKERLKALGEQVSDDEDEDEEDGEGDEDGDGFK